MQQSTELGKRLAEVQAFLWHDARARADPSCMPGEGGRARGFVLCRATLFSLPALCSSRGPISSHIKVMHKVSEGSFPKPW